MTLFASPHFGSVCSSGGVGEWFRSAHVACGLGYRWEKKGASASMGLVREYDQVCSGMGRARRQEDGLCLWGRKRGLWGVRLLWVVVPGAGVLTG